MAAPVPMSPEDLALLHKAAIAKQKALMGGAPSVALTPADMKPGDAAAQAMGRGDMSSDLGTSADDADKYMERLANQTATSGNASVAPPPGQDPNSGQPVPPPSVVPGKSAAPTGAANSVPGQVGGHLGPGVDMDPNVTIKVGGGTSMLEPKGPSGSDMPDPHAPEPQDEDPDGDDDGDEDDLARLPFRFG